MVELTEREKFIIYFLSLHIFKIIKDLPDTAVEENISKLKEARASHLSEEEMNSVIELLTEELLVGSSWLASLNKDFRNSEGDRY